MVLLVPLVVRTSPRPRECGLADLLPGFLQTEDHSRGRAVGRDISELTELARFLDSKAEEALTEFVLTRQARAVPRGATRHDTAARDRTIANLRTRVRTGKRLDWELANIQAVFEKFAKATKDDESKVFFNTEAFTIVPETENESEIVNEVQSEEEGIGIQLVVQSVVDSLQQVIEKVKNEPLPVTSVKAIFSGIIAGMKEILVESGLAETVEGGAEEPQDQELTASLTSLSSWPVLCKAIWYPYHVS